MLEVRLYILLSHTHTHTHAHMHNTHTNTHTDKNITHQSHTYKYGQWHAYKHLSHRPPPDVLLHSLRPGWIVCCHGNPAPKHMHVNTHTQTPGERALPGCSRYFLISCVIKLQQMNWYCVLSLRLIYNLMISELISFPMCRSPVVRAR